jgi:nucleotide-binding universal stress UspA family protein
MSQSLSQHPVVVGVDGSVESLKAVDWAAHECERRHLQLHLVHAWDTDFSNETLTAVLPLVQQQSRDVLRAAARRASQTAPDIRVNRRQDRTRPATALVDASRHADTVVVGTRGLGTIRGALVGSTSMQLAAHAHCPVVVVPRDVRTSPERSGEPVVGVVVGVDGSRASEDAIAYAFTYAAETGQPVTVVSTWDVGLIRATLALNAPIEVWEGFEDDQRELVRAAVAPWTTKHPEVVVHTQITQDRAADALVRASTYASLLVVGRRGRGGFPPLLLGSVSRTVLHLARCPVAVVPTHRDPDAS